MSIKLIYYEQETVGAILKNIYGTCRKKVWKTMKLQLTVL